MCGCRIENDARAGAAKMIGVSLPARDSAYYRDIEKGLRDEALKHGYQLIVTFADRRNRIQQSEIDSFMSQHVDAIVVYPVDSAAIVSSMARANALRVPVFELRRVADGRLQGTMAIRFVSDYFDGKPLPRRGSVRLVDRGVPRPMISSGETR